MKKRGRPPKKISLKTGSVKRRSAFDPSIFGIKKEDIKGKDVRWSAPDRVHEHQNIDGYVKYKAKEGQRGDESGNVRTKGDMVFMTRDKKLAMESKARKVLRTEQQFKSVKNMRREDIEKLSSKHGIDLHKHFLDKLEKQEDKYGG